jgi:signal peptidase I
MNKAIDIGRVKELLTKNPYIFLKISGTSMSFLLKEEDKIKVRGIEPEDIGIGDIIVYYNNYELKAHRVIRIQNKGRRIIFYTKGDSRIDQDTPIWKNQVVGKVVAIEKSYGTISIEGKMWRVVNRLIAFCSLRILIQKRKQMPLLLLKSTASLSLWLARTGMFLYKNDRRKRP